MSTYVLRETAKGLTEISLSSWHLAKGRVFVRGEITPALAADVSDAISYANDEDMQITVFIDSAGGDVSAGLSIIDAILSAKRDVTCICVGKAYSMASLLLMVGTAGKRYVYPHARVMIHEPYTGGVGGTASNIRERADELLSVQNILVDLIARHTGHDKEEVEKAMSYDHFFTAQEAIEYGIADHVGAP